MPDKFTQLLPALGALVAFLVAAVLVLYIYRLLFGRRIHSPGGRNRARRLDVVDVYDLDRERQLVIVRRDNVEHLLLIGGPTDILVEATISRLEGAVSRGPEQRPGPPAAANWPAGPAAPPRELETPLPKPAAAGPVNLPP
ncbi:MAG: flagellar biosynthetic protein FliO, partial [Methylocystis sp.]|nr:flagellar biosynthetic protein FliO [Methylocystis sp.]